MGLETHFLQTAQYRISVAYYSFLITTSSRTAQNFKRLVKTVKSNSEQSWLHIVKIEFLQIVQWSLLVLLSSVCALGADSGYCGGANTRIE